METSETAATEPTALSDKGSAGRAQLAAILGMLAVLLGALAAHALKSKLAESPDGAERWKTAVFYHLTHAVLLFQITHARWKCAWWCIAAGVVIFSGSLYCLAISSIKTFAHTAPVGGLLLMVGWLLLAIRARRQTCC